MKKIISKYTQIFEIIGAIRSISTKLYKDYTENKKDEEYQIQNPQNYSCIFEGNIQLETKKRKAQQLKKQVYLQIEECLKTFDFNFLIDVHDEIIKNSINQIQLKQWKEYSINIANNDIFKNEEQKLSIILDSLYIFFIQYIKGQYVLQNIQSEFIYHFKEIRTFIIQLILKYAEQQQKQVLQNLKLHLIEIVQQQNQNENLLILCKQLQSTQSILECKQQIETFFQKNQVFWINLIEGLYGFQLSEVILDLYQDQINQIYYNEIRKCLSHLYEFQEDSYQSLLINLDFHLGQYLENSVYFENYGIYENEINFNLQKILYLINWEKKDAIEVQKLMSHLCQLNGDVQNEKQSINDTQSLIFDNFNNIRQQEQDILQQSIQWYNKSVDLMKNKIIILQLYLFFLGFKITDDKKISFNKYSPQSRVILIKILRNLNNGQHNYNNILVLKILERITGSIYQQILQQSNQIVTITLINNLIKLQVDQSFYERNQFLPYLYKSNKIDYKKIGHKTRLNQIQELQHSYIQSKLKECQVLLPGLDPPKYFFFELISQPTQPSNVITLCISGFISKTEDKYNQWKGIIQDDGSTVIALHWSCGTLKEFGLKILSQLSQDKLATLGGYFFGGFTAIGVIAKSIKFFTDLYHNNPFTVANQEAKRAGKYLGQLIGHCKIFGDCQINIVCHSLGTVLLDDCIQELDQLYQYNKEQFINSVMMLGGAADVSKLQKRRWHSVGGSIYNIYSQNDKILGKLLGLIQIFTNPCGLQRVHLGYREVINYDFTEFIQGHTYYKEQMKRILQITDFDNDNKFIFNQEI